MDERSLQQVGQRIAEAASICVLTGAGMSAESGIPTFRDALTGLWSRFVNPHASKLDLRTCRCAEHRRPRIAAFALRAIAHARAIRDR
jgi:NAD-dependent SIR2 family protein deacetylase